jgi:hypothetical protein
MMPRPERAEDVWAGHFVHRLGSASQDRSTAPSAPPTRYAVQFGLGAILPHSNTPSLRVAGFEDEDDDEDEDEAPCEGGSCILSIPGVKTPG